MPIIRKKNIELLSQMNGEERMRYIENLPATPEQIEDLFDYLDVRLAKAECAHDLKFTMQYLMENRLNMAKFMSWLNENGAYCDCEILQDIEPHWFQAFADEA